MKNHEDEKHDHVVKIRWRCPNDLCKKTCTIRSGSFFERSKLSLQQWIVLIHWWVREYPVTRAAEEAKVTDTTAIQCYQYLRDICSWRLTSLDAPLLLGGEGVVIQIDESLFRHKPKVLMQVHTHCNTLVHRYSLLEPPRTTTPVRAMGIWYG